MYDLNLAVPDFTSAKYSQDNRFLLLKNYLYELNDILSFALVDGSKEEAEDVRELIENEKNQEKQNFIRLKNDTKKQLQSLTEKIRVTADEINEAVHKSNVEANLELARQLRELLVQAEGIFLPRTHTHTLSATLKDENSYELKKLSDALKLELERVEKELELFRDNTTEYIEAENIYLRKGKLEEGVYGVEIGSNQCNIKARFSSQGLSLFHGECEVAYIYEDCLHIRKGAVADALAIGDTGEGHFILQNTLNGLEVFWSDGN